ncbi:jagunal, ER re-organization during oogenesis domain-containing protein [Ditylenchus destructor]|nr:jagunal, ER re-organization during oogenesis domain-containing protein [Ditylenchus destructor]
MAARGGLRPEGTNGNDFKHRQKVADSIKLSVQYKFYLKVLFAIHLLVLLAMWVKTGGEIVFNDLKLTEPPTLWTRLDLPAAYTWERVWCMSFIPIIFALLSFPKNKALLLSYHYYGQFVLGILPCAIGLRSQFPELWDYMANSESKTPTLKGHFPMVILWHIFFLIVFPIHGFAMFFSYYLTASWKRDPKKSN